MKEPIRLRKKELKNNNISLYLDIYYNGKRTYEYLKLYLTKGTSKSDKEHNKRTLNLANTIKAKRILELHNNQYGFNNKNKKVLLLPYYEHVFSQKEYAKYVQSVSAKLIKKIAKPNITLQDVTPEWIDKFKNYLMTETTLKQNTAHQYIGYLRQVLNQALKDELIDKNPFLKTDNIKKIDTNRAYLTIDEIKLLANTPYQSEPTKIAFLFSCFTGIRKVDILKIHWDDLQKEGDFTRIIFRQKKTHRIEYLDISEQAERLIYLMDNGSDKNQPVFKDFHYSNATSITLRNWAKSVGINKDITFHSARHTFAVMMLSLGVDIYTVSKLLGHKSISTTQIYAKIMDKNKQDAIMKIPLII